MRKNLKYPKEIRYTIPSIKNDGRIFTFMRSVESEESIRVLPMHPNGDNIIFCFEVLNRKSQKKLEKIFKSIF